MSLSCSVKVRAFYLKSLLGGLAALTLLLLLPLAAQAASSRIKITESNADRFISVSTEGKRDLLCRLRKNRPAFPGYGIGRSGQRWISAGQKLKIPKIRSMLEQDPNSSRLRQLLRKRLIRLRSYRKICREVGEQVNPTPTVTPTPKESPIPSPSGTPNPIPTEEPDDELVATPGPPVPVVNINCGGVNYTDSSSTLWVDDAPYLTSAGSNTFSAVSAIAGTEKDPLYQSERFGNTLAYGIPLSGGEYEVTLHFAELYWTGFGARVFDVSVEGQPLTDDLDIFSEVGKFAALTKVIDVDVNDGVLNIDLAAVADNAKISAIEVKKHQHLGHPFLHVSIAGPPYFVDYDGGGSELVTLSSSPSHTHEFGHSLQSFEWREDTTLLSSTENLNQQMDLGRHVVSLTIGDDNVPPETLEGHRIVHVYPIDKVGGALAEFHKTTSGGLSATFNAPPANPDIVRVLPDLSVGKDQGQIAGTPWSSNVVVVMKGILKVPTELTYQFTLTGGSQRKLLIDGVPFTGTEVIAPGYHPIEARFAVSSLLNLPLKVVMCKAGAPDVDLTQRYVIHDETDLVPHINSAPSQISQLGGETVKISGVGFFAANQVTLHWGAQNYVVPQFTVSSDTITFVTPAGSGTIGVSVQTPRGKSNTVLVEYTTDVPVAFNAPSTVSSVAGGGFDLPTSEAWGPDGRLYVGSTGGGIKAYTFNDDYTVASVQSITSLQSGSTLGKSILGIAFNPFDGATVKPYVALSMLHAFGGSCVSSGTEVPYNGEIVTLEGPNFTTITHLITGLPVSNHDHGVNGMDFNNAGDLFITIGGNTNAGIADCNLGDLPETPLSAAILRAPISNPSFDGVVVYDPDVDDQFGEGATQNVISGDLEVFASGERSAFDLAFTTSGEIYALDNGPNGGFGPASTSATTQAADPNGPDELDLIIEGNYYGHPNRNRGRTDDRQNVYRNSESATAQRGIYTSPLYVLPPSANGLSEYRATTFGGKLRGGLLMQRFGFGVDGDLYGVKLGSDGRDVSEVFELAPGLTGLDAVAGPGGAIVISDYSKNKLSILQPNDQSVQGGMRAFDIFPWRAPAAGGTPFIIGGAGFGNLGNTTVEIGGVEATLTSVSPTRIRGTIPTAAAATSEFLDVVVGTGTAFATIPQAFRYLLAPGEGEGIWTAGVNIPNAFTDHDLEDLAGGIIDGVLYLVGKNSDATFAYDFHSQTWDDSLAQRPYASDHHTCAALNHKLYCFGGVGDAQDATITSVVQIYDPVADSWSTDSSDPLPYHGGAAASAVIDGKIYVAGGLNFNQTVADAAIYDPTASATNRWTTIDPMPFPRDHASGGTDGEKFYVFAGRNIDQDYPAVGESTTMVYDPATGNWISSLAPIPQRRAGMGQAAWYRGEFYLFGGETSFAGGEGSVGNSVYDRVDVYNPATDSWRRDANLPTPRHGQLPVVQGDRIHVIGGGTTAGGANPSGIAEILAR